MGVIEDRRRIIAAQPHLVTASGSAVLVNIAEPKIERLKVTFSPVQTGSGTPSPSNVRPIMGYATIMASIGTMPVDISLGGTYYSGTVDLVSGTMTVTHGCYAFTGNEAYSNYSSGQAGNRYGTLLANLGIGITSLTASQCKSSHFALRSDVNGSYGDAAVGTWFFAMDPNNAHWTNTDAYKTWVAGQYTNGTPVRLLYPLPTPQTVTLTPQTIAALRGQQTVTSPAGNVEISYWTH